MDETSIKMLSAKEVCELMRISLDTLHKWLGMGLVGYKIDKVIRIPENKLWEFLARLCTFFEEEHGMRLVGAKIAGANRLSCPGERSCHALLPL
jgi:hypothetical protein